MDEANINEIKMKKQSGNERVVKASESEKERRNHDDPMLLQRHKHSDNESPYTLTRDHTRLWACGHDATVM
jgi:hypothetical protein